MDTGKIMIGFSLVLLSLALMVGHSSAAGPDIPCRVGCGSAVFSEEQDAIPGTLPLEEGHIPSLPVSGAGTGPGAAP